MQFDIPVGSAKPRTEARRAELAAKLSRKSDRSRSSELRPSSLPSQDILSQEPQVDVGLVPTPMSTKGRHANPNYVSPPADSSRAIVVVSPTRKVNMKPGVPSRREAAENHELLRERDYQTQHEELTHLRSNLPDLEKSIALLKAETVRLRAELLVKGRDCEHFKLLSNQMKAARDREVSSLALARSEWGKTVADRDQSIEKLQKDLSGAREALTELTGAIQSERSERSRIERECSEEVARCEDKIRRLNHELRLQEDTLSSKEKSFQQAALNQTQTTNGLRSQISALTRENEALRAKVVDWEVMSTEVTELQRQITEFKRNRNATESRLRQELGDAAEEIFFLREEKQRLLQIVEKLELQTNAAISVSENGRPLSEGLSHDEEIGSLTSSRTRITRELQSFREGEWSNTLGSIGKLRQHLTEEEILRRNAEERCEQERAARKRVEQDIGEKLRVSEKNVEEIRGLLASRDREIRELHLRQQENAERYSQLKADAMRDREELSEATRKLAELSNTLDSTRRKNEELEGENANLFTQLTGQSEIVLRLENELANLSSTKESCEDMLRISDQQRAKLQGDYATLATEHASLTVECRELRKLSHELQSTLNAESEMFELGPLGESGDKASYKERELLSGRSDLKEKFLELFTDSDRNEVHRLPLKHLRMFAEYSLEHHAQIRDETKNLEDRLANSAVRISELESTTTSLAQEFVRKAIEGEDLSRKITELDTLVESTKRKLNAVEFVQNLWFSELERTHENMLAGYFDLKQAFFSQVNALTHQKIDFDSERTKWASLREDLENKISTKCAESESLKNQLQARSELEVELKKCQDSLLKLKEENMLCQTRVEKAEGEATLMFSGVRQIETLLEFKPTQQDLGERLEGLMLQFQSKLSTFRELEVNLSSRMEQLLAEKAAHVAAAAKSDSISKSLRAEVSTLTEARSNREITLQQQLSTLEEELGGIRRDRTQERKRAFEKHDFDTRALQAKIKHAEARRKEVEGTLTMKIDQLNQETKRREELESELELQAKTLKEKAQRDLEQMRASYERALAKLRSLAGDGQGSDELRRRLLKAEKELRDIKQVQLHW